MKLKILAIAVLAFLLPIVSRGTTPNITVSATGVSILGTSTPISISVSLIDPNYTGNLRVVGSGVIPIFQASSATPGTTTSVGPIYGNDVIVDGFGNINATYYKVQVFVVTNGIVASTPSLQNFYAFQGSGTVDLATATPLAPSFMSGVNGSVVIPGNLTVNGALTLVGGFVAPTITSPNVNSVLYVGGSLGVLWGVTDIMAQINAAKTAAPTSGATIYVLPQSGGGCYLTTGNLFVANTVGQVFDIKGVAPLADSNSQVISGSCIQDTNTGAHNLFTFDWTPTGGGNFLPAGGIENLAIVNSSTNGGSTQCVTNGGCGSSAVALSIGGTNAGAAASTYRKFYTGGFGTGVKMQNTAGNSWGMSFYDSSWAHDTLGVDYALDTTGHENDAFTNCKFIVNGTNIAMGTTTQLSIVGGSMDSHITAGITLGSGTTLSTTNVRWENLGTGNTSTDMSFIVGSSGSQVHVTGGKILDDTGTGTSTQSYFTFDRGSVIGMDFFADASRTYTGTAFNCLSQCFIQVYNGSPAQFPVAGGGTTGNVCPPLTCDPHIGAQNPYGNAFSQILTKSAANVGVSSNASVYFLRDNTSGSSVIVTVDNAGGSVTLSGAAGTGATFVASASPTSSQIGLTYATGFLQIKGGSSTGSDVMRYTQVITQ